MAWFFDHPRLIRKLQHDRTAQEVLDRLSDYLDDTDEPVKMLCGFWDDEQQVISYQELRELIVGGYVDEVTLDLWRQDYAYLVTERMPAIWSRAMIAGTAGQPVMDKVIDRFTFETQRSGALEWMRSRGSFLVTSCTQTQKDAISLLLEDKVRNGYSIDELAQLIRPCIGLTRSQTSAARNYYDTLLKNLTEQHPRTKAAKLQAKAMEKTAQYAERLHRQRALTIAQTEMAYAYNYGADEGIRQAQEDYLIGKCVKKWCTSGDDQVCERCAALDGTEVGMEETFFSGNHVDYDESGLFPPLHPRCACAIEYIEVEPPAIPAEDLQSEASGDTMSSGDGPEPAYPPEEYRGDYEDFSELTLDDREVEILTDLRRQSDETGWEYGRLAVNGEARQAFTSGSPNVIGIKDEMITEPGTAIYHSHTDSSLLSRADLRKLTLPNTERVSVICANGDAFSAYIGAGYRPSAEEFDQVVKNIYRSTAQEVRELPHFYSWTPGECNYVATRETAYQIARYFGWTLEGGKLL